jgi:hypothetical protein
MKPIVFTSVVVLMLMLTGCSGIKISGVTKEPEFAISKYKTFGFHETEVGGTGLNDVHFKTNLDLLKSAIIKQMEAKGVTRTQSSPDLILNIGVVVEEKIQTRTTSMGNPGDRSMAYMGARSYSWQSQEVKVGEYREGSVKIDLVDAKGMKLVWTGVAESVLPEKQKNIPAVIEEAMAKLFAEL